MKHLRILFVMSSWLVLVMLLAGCGDGADAGNSQVVGNRVGNMAPNFMLQDLNGGTVDLQALRGKVVLIDFWDTFCRPCKIALPHLEELHRQIKDDDFVILAVAGAREGEGAVRSFLQQNDLTFPCVIGDSAIFRAYNISNIPATFIIAPDGVIHASWVGGKSKNEYAAAIQAAGIGH